MTRSATIFRPYSEIADYREEDARDFAGDLSCLIELRGEDALTGVQFRDCIIDYTRCPNARCVKKLV
jgi:hypothetical protein